MFKKGYVASSVRVSEQVQPHRLLFTSCRLRLFPVHVQPRASGSPIRGRSGRFDAVIYPTSLNFLFNV